MVNLALAPLYRSSSILWKISSECTFFKQEAVLLIHHVYKSHGQTWAHSQIQIGISFNWFSGKSKFLLVICKSVRFHTVQRIQSTDNDCVKHHSSCVYCFYLEFQSRLDGLHSFYICYYSTGLIMLVSHLYQSFHFHEKRFPWFVAHQNGLYFLHKGGSPPINFWNPLSQKVPFIYMFLSRNY